jgi:hypothetical protein
MDLGGGCAEVGPAIIVRQAIEQGAMRFGFIHAIVSRGCHARRSKAPSWWNVHRTRWRPAVGSHFADTVAKAHPESRGQTPSPPCCRPGAMTPPGLDALQARTGLPTARADGAADGAGVARPGRPPCRAACSSAWRQA